MQLVLIAAIAVVSAFLPCLGVPQDSDPWFCHNYDCPRFKMLKSAGDDVELREYEKSHWASTNVTNKKLMDAQAEGNRRLQQYLDKGNDADEKIEQTNPVFTLLYPTNKGPKRAVEGKFTVEFFVPHKYQDKPPKPKRSDCKIIGVPKYRVYVQSFGGYATEEDIISRAYDLMEKLKNGGEDVDEDVFGFAQYDSWIRVVNRHNEIWVWPKQKPSLLSYPTEQ